MYSFPEESEMDFSALEWLYVFQKLVVRAQALSEMLHVP